MQYIKRLGVNEHGSIVAEPRLGVFIDRVAKDAQDLANNEGKDVEIKFNDTRMTFKPGGEPSVETAKYWSTRDT